MQQPLQVSTVVVGSWNPRIFTPKWIKTNLFELSAEQEIQGMVNFEDMDFGFQYEGIALFPKSNLIEINFDGYDAKRAATVSSIVIRMLEFLPQTPIKALGVNIRYQIPKDQSLTFINTINSLNVKFQDFALTQIKQSLVKETYQINIISDISKNSIGANFNFHYSELAPFDSNFIHLHYEETQKILTNGN